MKKILIFGNSGAGKTTLAKKMAKENQLPHLDLDNLTWDKPGARKAFEDSLESVNEFIQSNESWIIEGCYGALLSEIVKCCTEIHFLNPGIKTCIKNNLTREWEPEKYESDETQNKNLETLQDWVKKYKTRTDEYSLDYHRKIFDEFNGKKLEYLLLTEYDA